MSNPNKLYNREYEFDSNIQFLNLINLAKDHPSCLRCGILIMTNITTNSANFLLISELRLPREHTGMHHLLYSLYRSRSKLINSP